MNKLVNLEFGQIYKTNNQYHIVENIDRAENTLISRVFDSELEASIYHDLLWEELSDKLKQGIMLLTLNKETLLKTIKNLKTDKLNMLIPIVDGEIQLNFNYNACFIQGTAKLI